MKSKPLSNIQKGRQTMHGSSETEDEIRIEAIYEDGRSRLRREIANTPQLYHYHTFTSDFCGGKAFDPDGEKGGVPWAHVRKMCNRLCEEFFPHFLPMPRSITVDEALEFVEEFAIGSFFVSASRLNLHFENSSDAVQFKIRYY